MENKIFKQLKRIFCLVVFGLISIPANAVLINFNELDRDSYIDANGDLMHLTNEYESQGLVFEAFAYLDGGGGVSGPGLSFYFVGSTLPTYVSFNLGTNWGVATGIDVRGPNYRETFMSSGAIIGMVMDPGTPYIPNEIVSFSSPTGISSVNLSGKAGAYLDDLTYTYNQTSVPEPSTIILFGVGLLGLFGSHVRSRLSQSK